MWRILRYDGETVSHIRVARLMADQGLYGAPQRRRRRWQIPGDRPDHARNHLERDVVAFEPNTKWMADITYVRTAKAWLYVCAVTDIYSKRVVGCRTLLRRIYHSYSGIQAFLSKPPVSKLGTRGYSARAECDNAVLAEGLKKSVATIFR